MRANDVLPEPADAPDLDALYALYAPGSGPTTHGSSTSPCPRSPR